MSNRKNILEQIDKEVRLKDIIPLFDEKKMFVGFVERRKPQ